MRTLTAAIMSLAEARTTLPLYFQQSAIRSISTSTPFRPSITTHEAMPERGFSQSASHFVPYPAGLRSIRDILAGPSFGITAPHSTASEPSAANFTA